MDELTRLRELRAEGKSAAQCLAILNQERDARDAANPPPAPPAAQGFSSRLELDAAKAEATRLFGGYANSPEFLRRLEATPREIRNGGGRVLNIPTDAMGQRPPSNGGMTRRG